mgnify:CR=1 FL=1
MRKLTIAALALLALPAVAHAEGDAAKGEKVFAKCKACHVVDQETNRVGPHLKGVIGRNVSASKRSWAMGLTGAAGSFGQYVPANVTYFGGTAGTFSGGRPEVNTTHAAGTAWNSGAIGAATLASDTITAAKIAADLGLDDVRAELLPDDKTHAVADLQAQGAKVAMVGDGRLQELQQARRPGRPLRPAACAAHGPGRGRRHPGRVAAARRAHPGSDHRPLPAPGRGGREGRAGGLADARAVPSGAVPPAGSHRARSRVREPRGGASMRGAPA